jgi:cytochrome P450
MKETVKDDVIDGYKIPKKTPIVIPIYNVHRDLEIWPEPLKYNPDRFIDSKYDPVTFIPFSYGQRKCIGARFSYVETIIILCRLLQKYEVEFEEGTPADFNPPVTVIITSKIKYLNLVLKPRQQ